MHNEPSLDFVPGYGGADMAVHRLGSGLPVVMIHGFVSNAQINWIRYGHAATLAAAGFEAVMIDMRAHGRSAAPHDPAAYPRDVQLRDIQAVLAALGIEDCHLVGYSLGARMAAMLAAQGLVAHGLGPRRLVIAGMGLKWLVNWSERRDYYLDLFGRLDSVRPGDPDYLAAQFIRTTGADPVALALFLQSTGDFPETLLDRIAVPTLVLAGEADADVQPVAALADRLPHARSQTIAGNHMSCVTRPELGRAIADFLLS